MTIIALAALGLAPAATAVPKTLCLQWSQFPEVSCLTIKASGSIVAQSGTNKYYAITGDHIIPKTGKELVVPVNGTGQLEGTKFAFSFTGTTSFDPGTGAATYIMGVEGVYDLVSKTGTLTYHWTLPTDGSRTVTGVDCKTVVIPASQLTQKE